MYYSRRDIICSRESMRSGSFGRFGRLQKSNAAFLGFGKSNSPEQRTEAQGGQHLVARVGFSPSDSEGGERGDFRRPSIEE
jgi:hypothetical protein